MVSYTSGAALFRIERQVVICVDAVLSSSQMTNDVYAAQVIVVSELIPLPKCSA